MMTDNVNMDKDHELLIRIDERLCQLNERLAKVEQIMINHQTQSNENKARLDRLYSEIYGEKNSDGIYQKVEKHDQILTKAVAFFTVCAIIIEILFKFFVQ